jgi:hypothetical protein
MWGGRHLLSWTQFLLYTSLLPPAELSWHQVFKQLCKLYSSCPLIEIRSFEGAQLSRCLPPPFLHLRTETDPVSETSCVLWNTGRWIKSRNPEISCAIQHRQNPSETKQNYVKIVEHFSCISEQVLWEGNIIAFSHYPCFSFTIDNCRRMYGSSLPSSYHPSKFRDRDLCSIKLQILSFPVLRSKCLSFRLRTRHKPFSVQWYFFTLYIHMSNCYGLQLLWEKN